MGGERAATVRRREQGKICWQCGRELGPLPPGYSPGTRTGERLCDECAPRTHRVCCNFMRRTDRWAVHFVQGNLLLGDYLYFQSEEPILRLLKRAHASTEQLEHARSEMNFCGRGTVAVNPSLRPGIDRRFRRGAAHRVKG